MKRITFILIALCAITFQAKSQFLPNDYFQSKSSQWILRAGTNLSTVVGKDSEVKNFDKGNNVGFDVSVAYNQNFTDLGLFWGIEAGLSDRGYKYNKDSEKTSTYNGGAGYGITYDYIHTIAERKMAAYNIYVQPVTIGYRRNVWKGLALEARIGAFVSVDMFGDMSSKSKTTTRSYNKTMGFDKTNVKEDESSTHISDIDGYHRVDVGISPSFGIWWSRLGVDFTYRRGFIGIMKNSKTYSSQFDFRVCYAF